MSTLEREAIPRPKTRCIGWVFWPRMDPNKPPGKNTTFAFTNRFCYNKLVVQ